MPYEFLAHKDIDLSRLGYKNASVEFDFRKESSDIRITLFNDDHYQDQVVVSIEDEFGCISDGMEDF